MHKSGKHYERGAAGALARGIGKPASWVSHYVDDDPERNADLDTALAICSFYDVSLDDFRSGTPEVQPPPLRPAQVSAMKLAEKVERLPERVQLIAWKECEMIVAAHRETLRQPDNATQSAAGSPPATRGNKR